MKRFNRRQFLKTTGAAAGAALLGQGCAPSPTPALSSQEELLEEANILVDGKNVTIPPCCSYEGEYHIDHPPKRPMYGIWAQKFEEVIGLLKDDANFPDTDPKFINAIKNCLGFAVDKLFQGDTHSTRNALAVVAYMLVHASQIELWLQVPTDQTGKNPNDWLTIDYSNPENQTDLWDLLTFSPLVAAGEDKAKSAGSRGITKYIIANKEKYPLLYEWLDRLVRLADSMDLWQVFGGEVEKVSTEYQAIEANFKTLLETCPEGYGCANFEVTDEMFMTLVSNDLTFGKKPTYVETMIVLIVECSKAMADAKTSIEGDDSLGCEKWLEEAGRYVRMMKDVVLEFVGKVDNAVEQEKEKAEAYARARNQAAENDLPIWELIPYCLVSSAKENFEESLDDWWGAKKYIVGAGCAIVHVPIIVATAGAAIIPAILDFVLCFLRGMVDEFEIIEDFGRCVVENW